MSFLKINEINWSIKWEDFPWFFFVRTMILVCSFWWNWSSVTFRSANRKSVVHIWLLVFESLTVGTGIHVQFLNTDSCLGIMACPKWYVYFCRKTSSQMTLSGQLNAGDYQTVTQVPNGFFVVFSSIYLFFFAPCNYRLDGFNKMTQHEVQNLLHHSQYRPEQKVALIA